MILDIDKFLGFLNEKALNANEFLILYLTYQGRVDDLEEHHNVMLEDSGAALTIKSLERLVEKDLLYVSFKRDENKELMVRHGLFVPDIKTAVVTSSFTEEFMIPNDDAADELFDRFPAVIHKNNITIKRSDGGDMDKAMESYRKYIDNDRIKHVEVIRRLEIAKKHNLIESGFPKWVLGRMWEDPRIKTLEDNDDDNGGSGGEVL